MSQEHLAPTPRGAIDAPMQASPSDTPPITSPIPLEAAPWA